MEPGKKKKSGQGHHALSSAQRYFITGTLTIIPIIVTWWIVSWLLRFLSSTGRPIVNQMSDAIAPFMPQVAEVLRDSLFQSVVSIILVVGIMILLGWIATRVLGKRVIEAFDKLINRIPLVRLIYNSMKRLISALQKQPDHVQRVVLIEFPSPEMKTVGLVTRTFIDKDTGRKVAAVYVPTTPNPTSGYLEIVPLDRIVSTNWTIDEAMTFIISGGAIGPHEINYDVSYDESKLEPLDVEEAFEEKESS